MSSSTPIVAVTSGDVSGIGPEIVLRAVRDPRVARSCRPLLIGDPGVLHRAAEQRATAGKLTLRLLSDRPSGRQELEQILDSCSHSEIAVLNPLTGDGLLAAPPAKVNAAAGDAAFHFLCTAAELAIERVVDAVSTAPISKAALHLAGHHYPGHTEILGDLCGADDVSMMLHLPESRLQSLRFMVASEKTQCLGECGLSIAHVTLHTSLSSVPELLTQQGVESTTILMHDFLGQLGSSRKAIAVAALNPHAGEDGLFGSEETTIIAPAVKAVRDRGCRVTGPLPVDTLIRRAVAGEFDGVIAMYHDQGHIPVKLIGFDAAVNITLGLPIIRTSPTHGTAFDRAWNPKLPVDPSGMMEAVLMAVRLSARRDSRQAQRPMD